MCIFKAGLSSLSDGWAKYKENVPDIKVPIKILKQHAIRNSSLQNLKISSSKGYRRKSQKWIIYVANTAINFRTSNFQRKISFQIMGFYFDWWILLLLTLKSILYPRCYKVSDSKTFKSIVVSTARKVSKYRPEITPYLDIFHAVIILRFVFTNHL